jgi:hypothetical protein
MLGRIYDYLKSDLTTHQKAVNIWLLYNKSCNYPDLPPQICPCEITLDNGLKFNAYLDQQKNNSEWIEYGDSIRIKMKGRRTWDINRVIDWKLI